MKNLDLTGLCCAVPQVTVWNTLKKMAKGDSVEIRTDDEVLVSRDIIPIVIRLNMRYEMRRAQDAYIVIVSKD